MDSNSSIHFDDKYSSRQNYYAKMVREITTKQKSTKKCQHAQTCCKQNKYKVRRKCPATNANFPRFFPINSSSPNKDKLLYIDKWVSESCNIPQTEYKIDSDSEEEEIVSDSKNNNNMLATPNDVNLDKCSLSPIFNNDRTIISPITSNKFDALGKLADIYASSSSDENDDKEFSPIKKANKKFKFKQLSANKILDNKIDCDQNNDKHLLEATYVVYKDHNTVLKEMEHNEVKRIEQHTEKFSIVNQNIPKINKPYPEIIKLNKFEEPQKQPPIYNCPFQPDALPIHLKNKLIDTQREIYEYFSSKEIPQFSIPMTKLTMFPTETATKPSSNEIETNKELDFFNNFKKPTTHKQETTVHQAVPRSSEIFDQHINIVNDDFYFFSPPKSILDCSFFLREKPGEFTQFINQPNKRSLDFESPHLPRKQNIRHHIYNDFNNEEKMSTDKDSFEFEPLLSYSDFKPLYTSSPKCELNFDDGMMNVSSPKFEPNLNDKMMNTSSPKYELNLNDELMDKNLKDKNCDNIDISFSKSEVALLRQITGVTNIFQPLEKYCKSKY